MSSPASSAPMAPCAPTYPDAIYWEAWNFNSPIFENIAFILLTHHSDWVSEELDDGNMYCCAAVFCCLNCVRKSPRAWTAIISAPIAAALSAFKRHLLWPQILPKAEFMCLCVCVRVYINSNVSMGKISLNHHNENEGLQRVMQCNFMLPIVAQIGFGKWGRNDN